MERQVDYAFFLAEEAVQVPETTARQAVDAAAKMEVVNDLRRWVTRLKKEVREWEHANRQLEGELDSVYASK